MSTRRRRSAADARGAARPFLQRLRDARARRLNRGTEAEDHTRSATSRVTRTRARRAPGALRSAAACFPAPATASRRSPTPREERRRRRRSPRAARSRSAAVGRSGRASLRGRRTASSRPRDDPRARSRLAMFAQAIRSTNPTAPSSASRADARPPRRASCSGMRLNTIFSLDCGCAASSCRDSVVAAACAWGKGAPGGSRATDRSTIAPREGRHSVGAAARVRPSVTRRPEARGHDPDDLVRLTVECDHSPDGTAVAAEIASSRTHR